MAKVILSLDGLVLKELTLTKERTTIGRKSHSDIHIDNLAVSGDHAAIISVIEDYFLEDLGSTNGTFVNGAPVKRQLLKTGDVIELGKFKLEFVGKSPPPAKKADDYEKTMVYRRPPGEPARVGAESSAAQPIGHGAPANPAAAQPTGHGAAANPAAAQPVGYGAPANPAAAPAATASAAAQVGVARASMTPLEPVPRSPVVTTPRPAAPAAPIARTTAGLAPASATTAAYGAAARKGEEAWGAIRVVSGSGAGRERVLTKPVTTLGKPGVQVAMLTRRPQGYYLTHVEGARHPQVNGQTIGTEPFALNDHDIIELTGLKVEFLLRASPGSSTRKLWTIGLVLLVIVVAGFVLWRIRH